MIIVANNNFYEVLRQDDIKFLEEMLLDATRTLLIKAPTVQNTEVKEIIEHLNQVCKTNYKHTSAKTKTLVKARLKDGFTLDDFKRVHITKYAEWYSTDMQKYLRPETLYGTKFESYLNQELATNDKYKAVSNHTGMSALEILREQGRA